MIDTIFSNAEEKLNDRISQLKKDLAKMRIGQATPSLVEDIPVEAYGTQLTVKEVGAISVPQPGLIVISCWDDAVVEPLQKAIMESDLGVNPVVTGKEVKVPIPTLTEERREAMSREVGERVEEARVEIRQIRQDKMKAIDDLKENKDLSEDDHETAKKELQTMIDDANKSVEAVKEDKLASLKAS